jgi:hypothetical protein
MLSSNSAKILKNGNYSISSKEVELEISRPSKLLKFWKYLGLFLIISLPIFAYLSLKPLIFLATAILLLPLYKLLKGTETPVSVLFNKNNQIIKTISATGYKNQTINFSDVAKISLTSFEEFQDSNAFNDTVSKLQYFIDLELKHKRVSILSFVDVDPKELDQLKSELEGILQLKTISNN